MLELASRAALLAMASSVSFTIKILPRHPGRVKPPLLATASSSARLASKRVLTAFWLELKLATASCCARLASSVVLAAFCTFLGFFMLA